MTAKELFEQEDFDFFISDFEEKWLQFAREEEIIKTFFGNVENANSFFQRWKQGEDLFMEEKRKVFIASNIQ